MADAKTVRLRDANSGVTVQVSEETAANLYGFESADSKAPAKSAASSKTEK